MCHLRARLLIWLLLLQAGLCFASPAWGAKNAAQDGTHDAASQLTVSSGAAFRVEVLRRTRLQRGRLIQGRLLEPIYADSRLLIPSGALLEGRIATVRPAARGKRLDAKFHGDFTPLNEPIIQWTLRSRNDGSSYQLLAESAAGAGSTLYFRSSRAGHQSLFRRSWSSLMGRKYSAVSTVTAPHKWERLQKYFWSQMPYHPQYIDENTQYEMALTSDLQLPAGPTPAVSSPTGLSPEVSSPGVSSPGVSSNDTQTNLNQQKPLEHLVSVHSRLRTDLNSSNAKPGDPVEAIVTQPVLDTNNELIIPQGSILHGKVLHVAAARRWGRNGTLRFSFNELTLPSGFRQDVEATPTAIESSPEAKLAIDQEGGAAAQTDRSILAPLVMGLLSASAIGDDDGGLGKTAISSNGFALIGHLAAIGIGSRYVGGCIGAAGTGRAIYTRWLAHGNDTHFSNDTEVMLEMSPAHAHRMAPVHEASPR
jgi:hypothetical protein